MNKGHTMTAASLSVLICRVAITITGLQWLLVGDDLRLGIAAAALALTALPGNLIRDSLLRNATTTTLAILLAAHIVLGMQLEFYEKSALYDKAVHGFGSAAIAGILALFVQRYCSVRNIDLPAGLVAAFVLAGTVTAGTLWELFEFAIDRTGLFFAQRGLHDTMLDLLADTIGAVLAIGVFTTAACIDKSIAQTAAVMRADCDARPVPSRWIGSWRVLKPGGVILVCCTRRSLMGIAIQSKGRTLQAR